MTNSQYMNKQIGMMQKSMPKLFKIIDANNPQERERITRTHRQVLRQH